MAEPPSSDDPLGLVGFVHAERLTFGAVTGRRGDVVVHAAEHLELGRRVIVECLEVTASVEGEEARRKVLAGVREQVGLVHALCEQSSVLARVLGVSALVSPAGRWVPYVVRERFEGQLLEAWATAWRARLGRAPTAEEVIDLLGPLARVLAAAHRLGAAHGDLRTERVHVVDDGAHVELRLAGFGPGAPGLPTTHGAPEHFDPNFGPVGPRTDVFSLALLIVELLSGAPALRGESPGALCLASTSREQRPTPGARGVSVPAAFEAAMKQALAVEPAERFPDADAMWVALTAALSSAPSDAAAGVSRSPTKPAPEALARSAEGPTPRRAWPRAATAPALVGLAVAALIGGSVVAYRLAGAAGMTSSSVAPPEDAPPEDLLRAQTPAELEALARRHPTDATPLRRLALLEDEAGRHAEAVRAVQRADARSPKIADDAAMRATVLRAVRADQAAPGGEARRAALDLLEAGMGAAGPDLLYQLAEEARDDRALVADVERRLASSNVLARATPAARIAIELRATKKPCDRRALFGRAGREGDARALRWLTPLLSRKGCGFLGTGDCTSCLGNRADLEAAIAAIQARDHAAP